VTAVGERPEVVQHGRARRKRRIFGAVGVLIISFLTAACSPSGLVTASNVPAVPSLYLPSANSAGASPSAGIVLPTLPPRSEIERVPTRVRVAALEIDLPVVTPPRDPNHYPFCDVAEFVDLMSRPGRAGTTYLYAHARPGMFLPILDASRVDDGRSMVGLAVEVYTSDDQLFTYEVTEVRRHVTSIDFAYRATVEQLILQTSEGPHGTLGKTMLIATPRTQGPAAHADAHPAGHPVDCRPG
jgi:hypothetical protein